MTLGETRDEWPGTDSAHSSQNGTRRLQNALRTRWIRALLGVGIIASVAVGGATLTHRVRAATYDVCSTCTYKSINDALAAASAGATITVGPGTYGPGEAGATTDDTQIIISKSVNLVGAGIGKSIINDAPANQGKATQGVITITTPSTPGNITVSGFTVEGAIVNDSNDDGILMTITDKNASDVITVTNNLFYGDTTLDPQLLADQTDAIYAASNTATVKVSGNSFNGVFRAALIEGNPGAFYFTGNTLNLHGLLDTSTNPATFGWWAEGLLFLSDGGFNVSSPQVVSGNVFGSYPGMGVGVDAGYKSGQVGAVSNLTITNNVFNNLGVAATQSSTPDDSAISLHGFGTTSGSVTSTISGVTIKNNTFRQSSSTGHGYAIWLNGAIGGNNIIDHNLIQGSGASRPLAGITFVSPASSSGVSITNNIITGFVDGLHADALPTGAQMSVAQNCIAGNTNSGATVAAGANLTADHNWWGAASGPHATTNPSGAGNSVNGSATFTPFLTSRASICAGPVAKSVFTNPTSAAPSAAFTLKGTLSDTTTGNFAIASAQYNVNGGAYHTMSATDGSFDQVTEGVTAHVGGMTAGSYTVCVRGADAAGNTGAPACITLTVYNAAATQTAAAAASVTVSPTETPSADQPTAAISTATPAPTSIGFISGDGFPTIPVVIGGVAALIIVGSLLLLLLVRRRRNEEDNFPQQGTWRR